jgi:hypothetical protein
LYSGTEYVQHNYSRDWKILWNGNKCGQKENKVMGISRGPSPLQVVMDQKQLENVEHFSYFVSMITKNARWTGEIKSRIVMAKAAFNKTKTRFTSKLDLNLRKKLPSDAPRLEHNIARTLRKVDQKYLDRFKT